MLSSVVGVDADVLVGQVGGPELAIAFALVEFDGDRKLGLLEIGVCGGFIEFCGAPTIAADRKLAERNVDGLRIDLRSRVADSGHEPSPIGIAAGPCGLDERRV